MKISSDYTLRNIGGKNIVIPLAQESLKINGIIELNETGAFLWKLLSEEKSEQDLVDSLLSEYEIDKATAQTDVKEFIDKLKEAEILG